MSIFKNKSVVVPCCFIVLGVVAWILMPRGPKHDASPFMSYQMQQVVEQVSDNLGGTGSVVIFGRHGGTMAATNFEAQEKVLKKTFEDAGFDVKDTIWAEIRSLPEAPGFSVSDLSNNLGGVDVDAVISIFGTPNSGQYKDLKNLPPLYAVNVFNASVAKELVSHGLVKGALIRSGKSGGSDGDVKERFDKEYLLLKAK